MVVDDQPPQDFPGEPDTDHEGDALERVSRIRQWWEIVMTLKKTIMLLLGVGAVSVAGNINGTNYWNQVACEVGLYDCVVVAEPDTIPIVDDETVIEHTQGPKGDPGPQGSAGKDGKDGKDGKTGLSPELTKAIDDRIKKALPENHNSLH